MEIKNDIKVTGIIRAKCYDQGTLPFYQRLFNKMVGKPVFLGNLRWADEHKNVICNAGFEGVAEILAGVYASAGEINYMALGDGVGSPVAGDTTLVNEVYRNAKASASASSNELNVVAYYNEAETTGTYTEFGNFIDGAAGADTGLLWTHVNTGGWVKTGVDVLLVDCTYTFSSI